MPRSLARFETLEARQLRTVVYPSADQQYAVELLNRARANPTAEAARWNGYNDGQGHTYNGDLNEGLAAGTISAAAKQPLAINPYLMAGAQGHAQWMVDNDTFSHTGAGGSNPGQRESAAGYANATSWGENIAVNWSTGSLDAAQTVLDQERNLFTDQAIADRGHRTNMMNGAFSEVGIGIAAGPWTLSGTNYNAQDGVHDFAANGTHYLTGVSYQDTVRADQFYTPGEGLGGVIVTATRIGDGQTFSTTTWSSGGYSLALPAGTYNVVAAGGGLTTPIAYNNVSIGSINVKEDFVKGQAGDVPATPFAVVTDGTLKITGTAGPDVIGVSRKRSTYYTTMNGKTLTFSASDISHIFIAAGDGNDRVMLADTAMGSYIDGGAGKDTLLGSAANDSIYGSSGNDLIYGNDGNDLLVGGKGNDIFYGGMGNDRIYGLAGNDTVDAGAGNDHVWGGDGNDLLAGGQGKDALYGDAGADTLNGGRGTDYFEDDTLDLRISMEVLVRAA
ncbi:MAG: CAP domain-containing protein [Tepidisphaeraceae bacterium]